MRFLLIFVILFSAQSFAKDAVDLKNHKKAQVLFNGGKKADCQLIESSRIYKCLSDGATLYLHLNQNNFLQAIGLDAESNMLPISVAKLSTLGSTLYQSYTGSIAPEENNNIIEKLNNDVAIMEDFLDTLPEISALDRVGQALNQSIRKAKIDLYNLTSSKKYNIELADGSTKSCQRLQSTRDVCEIFSCEPGNSKDEATLLFYDSKSPYGSTYPTLQSLKNGKLIASELVTKVMSADNKKTIASFDANAIKASGQQILPYLDKSLYQDAENILFLKNDFAKEFYEEQEENCATNARLLDYKKARENLRDKLADLSVVEMIHVLEDGVMLANFFTPATARANGCFYEGIYYDEIAAKNLKKITDTFPKAVLPTQVISKAKVNELFKSAIAMDDIAWNYKYDGCYARAHIMARRFEAQGIRVDKAWIKGDLYVEDTDITWNYHVAPLLYVEDEKGKIQKMVIDPSIFDRPVTLEEWDNKIAKKTKKASVKTAFPFPQNASFYERSALAISNSDPYTPAENIDDTEETKMQHAKETMIQYLSIDGQNPY